LPSYAGCLLAEELLIPPAPREMKVARDAEALTSGSAAFPGEERGGFSADLWQVTCGALCSFVRLTWCADCSL